MPTKLGSLSLLLFSLTACGQAITEPPVTTPEPSITTASRASCAAFVDAYTGWATGCLGTTLPAGRRADLVDHCAARAALPGVEVTEGAIAACAAKISLADCAGVPLECLSPLGRHDNPGQLSYVWMGNSISDTSYDLFPRATGSLAAGAACDIGAQCQSGSCTSRDSCGSCVDESQVGEACGPTALCVGWRDQCTDGVCVEIGLAEGSACPESKGSSDCLSSLYCLNGTIPFKVISLAIHRRFPAPVPVPVRLRERERERERRQKMRKSLAGDLERDGLRDLHLRGTGECGRGVHLYGVLRRRARVHSRGREQRYLLSTIPLLRRILTKTL